MEWLVFVGLALAEPVLVMVPEDGRCAPGEQVVLGMDQPDTGAPWECLWTVDEALLGSLTEEDLAGDLLTVTCPDCGQRSGAWELSVHTICYDSDHSATWDFDRVLVDCPEPVAEPEPEGCACASSSSMPWLLWAFPALLLRRRRCGR
jgi:hypothetical protein